MAIVENGQPVETLTWKDVCTVIPLYRGYSQIEASKIRKAVASPDHFKGIQFDSYCVECCKESVFHSAASTHVSGAPGAGVYTQTRAFTFSCARVPSHLIYVILRGTTISDADPIAKIGQYPSVADLTYPELQKYHVVLGGESFKELTRGVGLAAHGVGIGAFVYLRRVFEGLIEATHARVFSQPNFDNSLYQASRMDEKIKMLSHDLPEFLVKNRSLYGILSKGVHELTESECLAFFPIIKVGIELILDEELQAKARRDKIAQVSKTIAEATESLNSTTKSKEP